VATSQGLQKDSILAVVKLQELQDLSQLGDLLEECYLAGTEGKTSAFSKLEAATCG
jgi:hypothetical protein